MTIACVTTACGASESAERAAQFLSGTADADSMGALPSDIHTFEMRAPRDLAESSAAVTSPSQADIVFTVNDSGNDAILFAMDTAGNARGRWKIDGATNVDWEAASLGPCSGDHSTLLTGGACLYIGDVGDNGGLRPVVTLYQLKEPLLKRDAVSASLAEGSLPAQALTFRYADGPHDVEAMYVGPEGTTYLLTKRPLKNENGSLRPTLVFTLPVAAWAGADTVIATLLDSLPIIPGSSAKRRVSDASLSFDSRWLAVRTYGQIYTFATDSSNGRVINSVAPAVCNIGKVEAKKNGEGVAWFGNSGQLLLTREGHNAPMKRLNCPLPSR